MLSVSNSKILKQILSFIFFETLFKIRCEKKEFISFRDNKVTFLNI